MSYLMMKITNWDAASNDISTDAVRQKFNLAADGLDENFGVISLSSQFGELVVMATPEAAKQMLAQHVDNTIAGQGPFVEGPFSNPGIGSADPEPYDNGGPNDRNCWDPRTWGPK